MKILLFSIVDDPKYFKFCLIGLQVCNTTTGVIIDTEWVLKTAGANQNQEVK